MTMIGHNCGPTMDDGASWRRHAWSRARADLLPHLPIEILRLRVKRAAELGLPYKTYASVRASTGTDVIGFLFSSNALCLLRSTDRMPQARLARLSNLPGCTRLALVYAAIAPDNAMATGVIDHADAAPTLHDSWPRMRDRVAGLLRRGGGGSDGYIVIGETDFERDWAEAGKTAGFLSGARFFEATPA